MSLFERTLEFSGFPFKRAEQDYLQIQSLDTKAFDYWQLSKDSAWSNTPSTIPLFTRT